MSLPLDSRSPHVFQQDFYTMTMRNKIHNKSKMDAISLKSPRIVKLKIMASSLQYQRIPNVCSIHKGSAEFRSNLNEIMASTASCRGDARGEHLSWGDQSLLDVGRQNVFRFSLNQDSYPGRCCSGLVPVKKAKIFSRNLDEETAPNTWTVIWNVFSSSFPILFHKNRSHDCWWCRTFTWWYIFWMSPQIAWSRCQERSRTTMRCVSLSGAFYSSSIKILPRKRSVGLQNTMTFLGWQTVVTSWCGTLYGREL